MPDTRSSHPKTAFVFAGGGSFGAVQVGMLRALAGHGIHADLVVGSSVGALNGSYYAGNPTPQGIARLEEIWRGLRRSDVFPLNWRSVASFLLRCDFLVGSEALYALVERHLPYRELEQASLPMHVVATDFLTGETVVLSIGPAAKAIVASAAIPAAFARVLHGKRYLADGAISSNTAVNVAVDKGAERLIVLPTGYACALERPPTGAVANALHALTLLVARQLTSDLRALGGSVEFFVLPPLCPLVGSHTTSRILAV